MDFNKPRKECPYCHGGRKAIPLVDDGRDFLSFDVFGSVAFGNNGTVSIHIHKLNYCPKCGRKLDNE